MRVLVLNGSPKGDKSNTYRLTSAFLDGLRHPRLYQAEFSFTYEKFDLYRSLAICFIRHRCLSHS